MLGHVTSLNQHTAISTNRFDNLHARAVDVVEMSASKQVKSSMLRSDRVVMKTVHGCMRSRAAVMNPDQCLTRSHTSSAVVFGRGKYRRRCRWNGSTTRVQSFDLYNYTTVVSNT